MLTAGFVLLHFCFGNGRSIFVLCFRQMGGTNTTAPAKAVSVLFAFGFHTSEQMEVQGRSLRSCLFYSQFVIKSIYIAAVERIFSDRHLIA